MSLAEDGAKAEEATGAESGAGASGGEKSSGRGSARPARGYTVILLPDHGGPSRILELSGLVLHFGLIMSGIGGILLLLVVTSWFFIAAQAGRVGPLESRVVELEHENRQVESIVRRFREVEAEYSRLRSLFGYSQDGTPDIWLPPSTGRATPIGTGVATSSRPDSWPLSERGYITQPLVEGETRQHPGIDIAIPTDSYIRSAGAGRVSQVGEDPILGHFLVIDHEDGYQSLYAHASSILVETGSEVRQNEVIALVGSSGQSTAPHLHFEISLAGERVDPLTMVTQP